MLEADCRFPADDTGGADASAWAWGASTLPISEVRKSAIESASPQRPEVTSGRPTRRQAGLGAIAIALGAAMGVPLSKILNPADLMQPGPLGDESLGSESAPVVVVEYASMSCPHCANFWAETFPLLKARYVDTGKVRFIFREFPLDNLGLAAALLARRSGDFFAVVGALFQQQHEWMVDEPLKPLRAIVRPFGLADESFAAALSDRLVLAGIEATRNWAGANFDVHVTPTFFINGEIHKGNMPFPQMERAILASAA